MHRGRILSTLFNGYRSRLANWLRCWISRLSSSIDWGAVWLSAFFGRGVQDRQYPAVSKVVVGSRGCRWFEIGSALRQTESKSLAKLRRVWWTVVDGGCCADAGRRKGGRRWWGADWGV